jgi:hypothetical protein
VGIFGLIYWVLRQITMHNKKSFQIRKNNFYVFGRMRKGKFLRFRLNSESLFYKWNVKQGFKARRQACECEKKSRRTKHCRNGKCDNAEIFGPLVA